MPRGIYRRKRKAQKKSAAKETKLRNRKSKTFQPPHEEGFVLHVMTGGGGGGGDNSGWSTCSEPKKAKANFEARGYGKDSVLGEQVGGDHYKKMGHYQPWEVLKQWLSPEEFRGYMKGTAIAYLAREQEKGGNADVDKAQHTLKALLEMIQ